MASSRKQKYHWILLAETCCRGCHTHDEFSFNSHVGIEIFRINDVLRGRRCERSTDNANNPGVVTRDELESYRYAFDPHNAHENVIKETGYFAPGMFRVYKQTLTSSVLENIPEFDEDGVPNYVGEKTLTLTKYVYVKGYDEENLVVSDVECTYPSVMVNGSWETTKPDMKHPLWLLDTGSGTANSFLNVGTYINRNSIGYLMYRFDRPVAIRGLVSLFYVDNAFLVNNENPRYLTSWYVEGRIRGNDDIPETDWFPITQFSHRPYDISTSGTGSGSGSGAVNFGGVVPPYVITRPHTFPSVVVDEIRVFAAIPNLVQTVNRSGRDLLPVIYWYEYSPLLYAHRGIAPSSHSVLNNDTLRNITSFGLLDGYHSGGGTQPHQMACIAAKAVPIQERDRWYDIVDSFLDSNPNDPCLKGYNASIWDEHDLNFRYPLLKGTLIDLDDWAADDYSVDYLKCLGDVDIADPLWDDFVVKLIPFRNPSNWIFGNTIETIPNTPAVDGGMRMRISPYPIFEQIDVKGVMYLPMIQKHRSSLAYLKFSPYPHYDRVDNNGSPVVFGDYGLTRNGYFFFVAESRDGNSENWFNVFKANPYRSLTLSSNNNTTGWYRRMSDMSSDPIGFTDDIPTDKWSCITCGNMIGEFSLFCDDGAFMPFLGINDLFGHEDVHDESCPALDAYVEYVKPFLTLVDNQHVTIYMRQVTTLGVTDRFLLRGVMNDDGEWRWTNYGRTARLAAFSVTDSEIRDVDMLAAINAWRINSLTINDTLSSFFGADHKLLWAYQQSYESPADGNRFIITSTPNELSVNEPFVETKEFNWNYLDCYHTSISPAKSKGLFFVLSGRALNNTFSRSVSVFSFGEFQMFHKKPPIGDTYRIVDKNPDDMVNAVWLDALDKVTTDDVYDSRDGWTGYCPNGVNDVRATMYPVATVYSSTGGAQTWSSNEVFSTLKDKAGIYFRATNGLTGGVTTNNDNRAFVVRNQVFSNMVQYVVYIPFPDTFSNYPDNITTANEMQYNNNWLPCRGWEYPFHSDIRLFAASGQ